MRSNKSSQSHRNSQTNKKTQHTREKTQYVRADQKNDQDKKNERKSEMLDTHKGPLYPREWRAVIGQHAILEALAVHSNHVKALWLQQGWESIQDLKKLNADYKNIIPKIEVKPDAILSKVGNSHQGAALFLDMYPKFNLESALEAEECCLVLLDGIEDPHNLGAILRTSWLLNIQAVLLPQDRSVKLTPTAHKVACGGAEHVPVEICTNFSAILERLKENDFWIFGLDHKGKSTIFDLKIPKKIVWCVGAEDKGLRTTTERLCDELVRIPQKNAAASYNASVATAMALLETHRQQSL